MLSRLKQRIKRIVYGKPASWRDEVPRAILRHVPSERPFCVVDIGAHDGDFTRAFSTKFHVTKALLIEALPHKEEKLRAEFKPPKPTVAECAASDRTGLADFEMNEDEATSSLLKTHRHPPELSAVSLGTPTSLAVQTRTLDDIAIEAGLSAIDMLKIDVQGAEAQVLAGASQILNRTRFVWIEFSFKPLYENSPTFFDIFAQMDAAGFGLLELTPEFHAPNREMLQADGLFFRRRNGGRSSNADSTARVRACPGIFLFRNAGCFPRISWLPPELPVYDNDRQATPVRHVRCSLFDRRFRAVIFP